MFVPLSVEPPLSILLKNGIIRTVSFESNDKNISENSILTIIAETPSKKSHTSSQIFLQYKQYIPQNYDTIKTLLPTGQLLGFGMIHAIVNNLKEIETYDPKYYNFLKKQTPKNKQKHAIIKNMFPILFPFFPMGPIPDNSQYFYLMFRYLQAQHTTEKLRQ